MDSHKVSVLPERLTVVELGRRRRWSEEEKLRIVLESLQAPRLVSAVARRHGITRSLLSDWRRTLKVERVAAEPAPVFVPAVVVPELPLPAKATPRRRAPRQTATRSAAPGSPSTHTAHHRRVRVRHAVLRPPRSTAAMVAASVISRPMVDVSGSVCRPGGSDAATPPASAECSRNASPPTSSRLTHIAPRRPHSRDRSRAGRPSRGATCRTPVHAGE